MLTIILFISVCFLAYANGANDNFKSVASLFGSGTVNFRQALAWATLTTLAGSLIAGFLAQTLFKFSGKGLAPDELDNQATFHDCRCRCLRLDVDFGDSVTVRAFNMPLEDHCEDFGQLDHEEGETDEEEFFSSTVDWNRGPSTLNAAENGQGLHAAETGRPGSQGNVPGNQPQRRQLQADYA